ncbi:MAG: hypothetical protein FWE86_03550 [Oscillospiraceae bacterium]|nr:hypothetical protein [Oscillospiraceae bacterium]
MEENTNPQAEQQPAEPQKQQYIQYYYCPYYQKPVVPAQGLGIAGMTLSLLGLFWAFIASFVVMVSFDYFYKSDFDTLIPFCVLAAIPSVLGLIFGGFARLRKNFSGAATAGVAIGIITLGIVLLSILASLVAYNI